MSLTFPRHRCSPFAVGLATAAVVTVGLTAPPGLADQVRDHEWWLTEVNVTQAWQVSRGTGVTVAVLDTGVDPNQPDLSRSVMTGPDETHSGRHLGDLYWGVHGTAMAVLIAGHGHGPRHADGIIGVAPKAKILSVRVNLEQNDALNADTAVGSRLPAAIAAGIRYAVHHGAQVIDLPPDPGAASADGTPGTVAAEGGSAAERSAVAYALAKNVVLVAPAGDDGPGPGRVNYPAAYPGVISVGAFDKGFVRAQYSSRRPYVTLTAPGDGVITATSETGYGTVSSTSAASAEVAGIAALIRARYPDVTPAQVAKALTKGTGFSKPAGRKTGSGYGTADAQGALGAAAQIASAGAPGRRVSAATTPPPAAQPASAPYRAGLRRDAIIGGGALLLLSVLTVIVVARRRRRYERGVPAHRPQPTYARITPPSQAAGSVQPWNTAQGQRPQLSPVPKFEPGRRSRQTEGPPWEPAPKPVSHPPWGVPDSLADDHSGTLGFPNPVRVPNGRDFGWDTSHGPQVPRVRDRADPPAIGPATAASGAGFVLPSARAAGETPLGAPPTMGGGDSAFSGQPALPPVPAPALPPVPAPALPAESAPEPLPAPTPASRPTPPSTPGENRSPGSGGPGGNRPPGSGRPAGNGPTGTGRPDSLHPDPPSPRVTDGIGAQADREQSAGPAFVWNPSAKTEDFPVISGGRARDGDNGQSWPAPPIGRYSAPAVHEADTHAFPAVPPAGRHGYGDADGRRTGAGGYPEDHGGYRTASGYRQDHGGYLVGGSHPEDHGSDLAGGSRFEDHRGYLVGGSHPEDHGGYAEDDGGGYPDDDGGGYAEDDEDDRHL